MVFLWVHGYLFMFSYDFYWSPLLFLVCHVEVQKFYNFTRLVPLGLYVFYILFCSLLMILSSLGIPLLSRGVPTTSYGCHCVVKGAVRLSMVCVRYWSLSFDSHRCIIPSYNFCMSSVVVSWCPTVLLWFPIVVMWTQYVVCWLFIVVFDVLWIVYDFYRRSYDLQWFSMMSNVQRFQQELLWFPFHFIVFPNYWKFQHVMSYGVTIFRFSTCACHMIS